MMWLIERIIWFWPSILILGFIAALGKWYLEIIKNWYWKSDFLKKTSNSTFLIIEELLIFPHAAIFGPCCEELLYRAPIIILFPTLNIYACIGILVSSIIFGWQHYNVRSDFSKDCKLFYAFSATIAGLILGFIGIKYQSIYLCAAVHGAWNGIIEILSFLTFFIEKKLKKQP